MKIKFYSYDKCGTCKKAISFMQKNEISFELIPIVETPPSKQELKKMLDFLKKRNLKINKLFNTSGELYREMKIKDKLDKMTEDEALALLSQHGKLIKRPFVLSEKVGVVGFDEDEWKNNFS